MFTLHLQGLCVGVFDGVNARLRVCCLNSGFNPAHEIPVHLPSLIASTASVSAATVPPLVSLKGRVRAPFDEGTYSGWDLTDQRVAVGGGGTLPTQVQAAAPPAGPYSPSQAAPDWNALYWVLSADRYMPAARIKPAALDLGDMTSSIVDITGGSCTGGAPETLGNNANYIWWFSLGAEQAVTDTMLVTFPTVPTVTLKRSDGATLGAITFQEGAEAWLINEATERDILNEKLAHPDAIGRHMLAYPEVFDNAPADIGLPIRLQQWQPSSPLFDTSMCIFLRSLL